MSNHFIVQRKLSKVLKRSKCDWRLIRAAECLTFFFYPHLHLLFGTLSTIVLLSADEVEFSRYVDMSLSRAETRVRYHLCTSQTANGIFAAAPTPKSGVKLQISSAM